MRLSKAQPLLLALVLACATTPTTRDGTANTTTATDLVGKTVELNLARHRSPEPFTLSSQKGKVLLVDVWATWCEPCLQLLPLYEQLQKQYGDKGFQVFAINVDEDLSQVDRYVDERGMTLPVLLNRDNEVEWVLGVDELPTSFLIDRRGVIRQIHRGAGGNPLPSYQKEIEALLAESP